MTRIVQDYYMGGWSQLDLIAYLCDQGFDVDEAADFVDDCICDVLSVANRQARMRAQ